MTNEVKILHEIKTQFGWPVDMYRYGIDSPKRYFDGITYADELSIDLQARVKLSLEKIEEGRKLITTLTRIPWVEMIFITGSVASLNAIDTDDIDIWMVVQPKRIWLTRALDFFIYTLQGKRRLSSDGVTAHRVKDKLCFNMYTTVGSEKLSQESVSYAIQFVDAIPLFVKDSNVYSHLIQKNFWIKKIFPTWYKNMADMFPPPVEIARKKSIVEMFLDLLEYISGVAMIAKAEKRLTLNTREIFRPMFTTWGTPRILSKYDQETITESS